jgi:hypothetical protein
LNRENKISKTFFWSESILSLGFSNKISFGKIFVGRIGGGGGTGGGGSGGTGGGSGGTGGGGSGGTGGGNNQLFNFSIMSFMTCHICEIPN